MNILAKFLAAKEPLFEHSLQQLERRTGHSGVDVTLIGEIYAKAADAACNLGLDFDANPHQLYQTLNQRIMQDDVRLNHLLGAKSLTDLDALAPLVIKKVSTINMPRQGFFIKLHVADRMLRQHPPLATLKFLGYPTIDSLLVDEDIYELFIALRFSESAEWLNQFNKLYTELTVDDFETRMIKLIQLDEKWASLAKPFIKKKLHNVTHSKELGAIGLLPAGKQAVTGATLRVLPLVLHYYNEVRLYSTFFKLVRHHRNFGDIVASTLIADPRHVSLTQGHNIHWRVIQRYYGKLKDEKHPEIFEPHLQPEDLHWRAAEEVLYELDPAMAFWRDLDYVAALKGDDIVPFNLMDVSLSYSNNLGYAERCVYHFRESLWNEIFARYFGHRTLRQQVLERLDNDFVAPEKIKI